MTASTPKYRQTYRPTVIALRTAAKPLQLDLTALLLLTVYRNLLIALFNGTIEDLLGRTPS